MGVTDDQRLITALHTSIGFILDELIQTCILSICYFISFDDSKNHKNSKDNIRPVSFLFWLGHSL